ncbi:hypothetical protein Rhopal_000940-T1 [Rhodotorula paludigena]|uniref:Fumarylacetoacetase-like C-terminal domain-containing protein n=1 Tax=Rhodotorula paludigena TaxID=86838 RepID=A0AAV5GE11_9BASI|nr:hypothetical protein Rhopal_000940-T1 [Rhodotorula paludigena]
MPAWDRLIRFVAHEDGQIYYGEPEQHGDLGLAYARGDRLTARVVPPDTNPFAAPTSSRVLTVRRLLSPLAPHHVTAIRGLGAQYTAESQPRGDKPPVAVVFLKPQAALAGPGDDIVVPPLAAGQKCDVEVELCVVLGKDAKDVREEDAMDYVGAYCVVNDVTSRDLCNKGVQWGVGKCFDTWCPIGPCLVSPRALGKDPHDLRITTHLNGRETQRGSTRSLVLTIPELIARLSHGTTLQAGSLLLTGSPIALGRVNPTDETDQSPFVQDGDEVRCFVEGCGTLINTVREVGAGQKARL